MKLNPNIDTILLDCDGVLTPAVQNVNIDGEKTHKTFHARDLVAIRTLHRAGYTVIIVSADDWPGTRHWAIKARALFIYTRDKGEIPVLDWSRTLACGDDYYLDKSMLDKAAYSCVPQDADMRLKDGEHLILHTKGGEGITTELIVKYNLL